MNNALSNKDCPPLMADGRHATDYRPSCYVHNMILNQNGLNNSHQMRMFLQKNAAALMQVNHDYFSTKNQCQSCNHFHVDPNKNDEYWENYKLKIGYNKRK